MRKLPLHSRPKLGLLWLLLFVLVRLQLSAHQAFTPHVTCPLDGELAHAHVDAPGHDAPGNDAHAASADPTEPAPADEHAEHCGLEPATQPLSGGLPNWPTCCVLVEAGPSELARAPLVTHAERLFLLAPKQSPPTRAG